MDSSKLGWRPPSETCLEEIAARWPEQVQVVVDACQMRLGLPRLKQYLDRAYIVIITGSKFFTGPPFSGALLVPAELSNALATTQIMPGLREYSSRSDWPMSWQSLRSRFPIRTNFGQWLRWEAALEEIRAYHDVPREFRSRALAEFGEGVRRIMGSSPSHRRQLQWACSVTARLSVEPEVIQQSRRWKRRSHSVHFIPKFHFEIVDGFGLEDPVSGWFARASSRRIN
jgi:hypothetical protein